MAMIWRFQGSALLLIYFIWLIPRVGQRLEVENAIYAKYAIKARLDTLYRHISSVQPSLETAIQT